MAERVNVTIVSELFDDKTEQEASIRTNLTVRALIEEIRREFDLIEGEYVLKRRGEAQALPFNKTLAQLGIQTGSELVFERERMRLSQQIVRRGRRFFQGISGPQIAVLVEEQSGQEFLIRWQPAIIGRASASNPVSAEELAVNLAALPNARTVSRQHAQITEQKGRYFLEGLAKRNPTFLNGEELVHGEKRMLREGDRIRVGKIGLRFQLRPA